MEALNAIRRGRPFNLILMPTVSYVIESLLIPKPPAELQGVPLLFVYPFRHSVRPPRLVAYPVNFIVTQAVYGLTVREEPAENIRDGERVTSFTTAAMKAAWTRHAHRTLHSHSNTSIAGS